MEERKEKDVESEVCEEGPPMETPERKQIGTPVPKFEDSPVFNYINNLSPIKTIRPTRISQTYNHLNFASLPTIFASPHVHSLKESLFLRRHQLPDPSKPEFPSGKGNIVDSSVGAIVTHGISNGQNESSNPVNSVSEASTEPNTECRNLSAEISKSINYEYCSPNCSSSPRSPQIGSGLEIVPFTQEMSAIDVCAKGLNIGREKQLQHNKEAGCDWKSLISDDNDLLMFDSPDETLNTPYLKSLDSCAKVVNSENDHMHTNDIVSSDALPHHEMAIPSHDEESHLKETDTSEKGSMPTKQIDSDAMSHLHFSMMRRRCLVYEMSGARMRQLGDASSSGSLVITQQDTNTENSKGNKELVPARSGNDSSHCILNGIGLHLNALARTTKDYNEVTPENLASGTQLKDDRSSIGTFPSLNADQELDLSLAEVSEERNIEPADDGVFVAQDASQASMSISGEELSQNSPKKKRRKSESGEIEGCKGCNCKKSKCLKLYCECFAAGVYCVEPCSCQECFNKPIHEDTVVATRKQIESRNPIAFAPKVISASHIVVGDESSSMTPSSARHKRGCNCKKSGCLKKYCECYQGGVGCSSNCRCDACKNTFGRKDGSSLIKSQSAEMEKNDTETTSEKKTIDSNLDKTTVINNVENFVDAFPATPLRTLSRVRSSVLTIGSSLGITGRPRFGKRNFLPPVQSKLNKKQGQEDEIPEILKVVSNNNNNRSPGSSTTSVGIKSSSSSSPNSKRVSPPDCWTGSTSTPAIMKSRKLILQSIPSFPALTPPKQ